MPPTIVRPAALVKQGNLRLFTTSLRVEHLMMSNFYTIERLDPDAPNDKGYQRLLNKGRAKKLADYLLDGHERDDAFLPTSIFLATDKNIAFDEATNTISFDVGVVGPFSVVDGQHRIEGLKLAAEKEREIGAFEVPVNIAVNLPSIAQMCHFLIVNTTQKSVDKAVEQRIFARLTEAMNFEDVPNLPKWIRRIVESGDDEQALRLVDHLNTADNSPWRDKIEMANDNDSKGKTISQGSFVKAIKRYVLTANNPISVRPPEHQKKIFFNYWRAIADLLDVSKPTVLFKYGGVELFCRFSTPVFNKLLNVGDFKTATIRALLEHTFENMDGEYAGVGHPDWWLVGTGPAGGLNAKALGAINQALIKALHTVEATPEIQM
jgi:DGQHR domain-containing protein